MIRYLLCVSFVCIFLSIAARGQEPTRQKIVLDFEGSKVFSKQELLEVANKCLAEFSKSRDEDSDIVLDSCLHSVRVSLFAKGYLGAELGKPRQERTENGLKTIVSVNEGALYRLGEVEISGSKLFSPLQIREMMGLKTGDIASGDTLVVGLVERVKKAYSNFGYIQYTAEVLPKFHLKDGAQEGVVDFTVNIDEGQMFTIRSIKFEGNGNIPEDALQREMLVRVGEVFNKEMFNEGLKRISQTGQFEEIDVDRDVDYRVDNESTRLDLTIRLKKKATTFRVNSKPPKFLNQSNL